jgi:hypothetical protein
LSGKSRQAWVSLTTRHDIQQNGNKQDDIQQNDILRINTNSTLRIITLDITASLLKNVTLSMMRKTT